MSRRPPPISSIVNGFRPKIIRGTKRPIDPPFFLNVGIRKMDPPVPASATSPGRGWLVQVAGTRTDGKGAGLTVEVPANASPDQVIAVMANALQYLNTLRNCSCALGEMCDVHRPKDAPTPVPMPSAIVLTDAP